MYDPPPTFFPFSFVRLPNFASPICDCEALLTQLLYFVPPFLPRCGPLVVEFSVYSVFLLRAPQVVLMELPWVRNDVLFCVASHNFFLFLDALLTFSSRPASSVTYFCLL